MMIKLSKYVSNHNKCKCSYFSYLKSELLSTTSLFLLEKKQKVINYRAPAVRTIVVLEIVFYLVKCLVCILSPLNILFRHFVFCLSGNVKCRDKGHVVGDNGDPGSPPSPNARPCHPTGHSPPALPLPLALAMKLTLANGTLTNVSQAETWEVLV